MNQTCEVDNKPENVKGYLKSSRFWKPFLSILIGGTGGFLYYTYVGCATGSCAITSNPYSSILLGSLLGYIVVKRPCSSC